MDCLKNIAVVLVSCQIPENIGFTARIMKNMSFKDLRLVNSPDLKKAFEVSKRARDIVQTAKVYSSLKEALSSFDFVLASTRRTRKDSSVYDLKALLPVIFSLAKNSKIAVLFGREDLGLSRDEIEASDVVFRIPSSEEFPSLNLSFAAGIFCYELFCFAKSIYQIPILPYARKKEIEKLYEYIEQLLARIGYGGDGIPRSKRIISSIKKIFRRTHLSKKEAEMLKGIFLKLDARLKKMPNSARFNITKTS
ncbi:MAG: RNA methyltransferase [Candidatus Omnitrophica bacterium]|nr:RNA methyltransferase [Candidatus Omnitrophota bacterium]